MLLFYAGLLPWVLAAPSATSYVHELKESFNAPAGWHSLGLPLPEHNIELQIGLHQPNFHVLEQHLYEVSDPDHVRYGQHLTKAQVDELVAPHDEALALVNEWLASYGVDDSSIVRSSARDWIRVTLPVKMVEEMLDTVRFSPFRKRINACFRPIKCGNTSTALISFARRATAFPTICIRI